MALPRISEAIIPKRQPQPVLLAELSDRAGQYTIEQLETLLQPLLVAAPQKQRRVWPLAHSVAFVVGVSLMLWSAIIFVAVQFL
jgi:hypothetical protein